MNGGLGWVIRRGRGHGGDGRARKGRGMEGGDFDDDDCGGGGDDDDDDRRHLRDPKRQRAHRRGPDWLDMKIRTVLRPIYARHLGWRWGPRGELSCVSPKR